MPDDAISESEETFKVQLSNPSSNATIGDGVGIGLIVDNDGGGLVGMSIADKSQAEGNSGTARMHFTVTLDRAPSLATSRFRPERPAESSS